ncbi:MAG: 1-acyl-sn-glycerol-3-phosphate acyltransferase [Patescibacteria group bacterium]|nr:1-acyl-sn-glycerol-3-phosphate acyltransferase [Patescibacteria group bacterium]
MNINLNLQNEEYFLHRATFRAFIVPIFTLSILTMFIPYLIREHSIHTTVIVFAIILFPPIISRFVDLIVDHHTRILDWTLTLAVLIVGVPVSFSCGLIGFFIVLIFPRSIYFVCWLLSTITIFMLGVRLTYDGEFPKFKEPFIVAGNHTSFLDYFLIFHVMGYKPWKIVYGINLNKYPLFQFFGTRIGIGVDRDDSMSKNNASDSIKKAIEAGFRVAIFPEGTRMRSNEMEQVLLPFKNGAFSAAAELGVGIQPVVFDWPILFSKPDKPLPLSPMTIKISIPKFIINNGQNRKELSNETSEVLKEALKP